jgi:hypothetical protein
MRKRRRQYDHRRFEDGNDVIPPGGRIRVFLADSIHHRQRQAQIQDALRKDVAFCSGHKPMPVADALAFSSSVRVNDTALDLARCMRDEAFESLCRRSARAYIDGPAVASPLNQLPPTPYDQQRPRDPDDDDNGDDDNGDDDRFDLNEAMRARDRARDAQYKSLRDQPWNANRNLSGVTGGVTDPTRANAVDARYERMLNQQPWRRGGG